MSIFTIPIRGDLELNEQSLLDSFLSGTDMRERILQLPLNLVIEIERTGDQEAERKNREKLHVARLLCFDPEKHEPLAMSVKENEDARLRYELTAIVLERKPEETEIRRG